MGGERKHSKKLDKKRAKALRKQHKKLQGVDAKMARGSDSDADLPFFMQDASIRAAVKLREAQAKEKEMDEKRAAKEAAKAAKKKRKRNSSSSGSDDSDDSG